MGTETAIEWTDHTWNPWIGCTRVSEGCRNCYAEKLATTRMGRKWGPGAERRRTSAANWKEPVKWANAARRLGRRDKVFCASLADVFDAEAPVDSRRDLWSLIRFTSDALDWQILTKRPERIMYVMSEDGLYPHFFEANHCWLMTSTENQEAADKRIPLLLQIPAAVHGISAEPLLGPLDLSRWIGLYPIHETNDERSVDTASDHRWGNGDRQPGPTVGISWIIVGGESGAQARMMKPEWARSLRNQCSATGTAFFMKQMGSVFGPSKGHELPEDLNIKQFPVVRP